MKHLHIFSSANSYFPQSFIPFAQQHGEGEHYFMVRHDAPHLHTFPQTIAVDFDNHLHGMVAFMARFHNVWIHSLFNDNMALTLAEHDTLARRAVWIVWGGELYNGSEAMFTLRRMLTPLFRATAFFTPQESPAFVKIFGNPSCIVSVFYPNPLPASCLCRFPRRPTQGRASIMLGHSAWPSERQHEGLALLSASSLIPAKIFLPLSYGDKHYAISLLQDTCSPLLQQLQRIPLLRTLPPERYGRFLARMDMALMMQQRQCALSTIYALLYMGIPVYVEHEGTRCFLHERYGIALRSPEELYRMDANEALRPLSAEQREKTRVFFDTPQIASSWNALFRTQW